MSRLKLKELLQLIDGNSFPVEYYPELDCFNGFKTSFTVKIQFGDDMAVRCSIINPILIPWYDETVTCVLPMDNNCMEVWLDSSNVRNLYSEYIRLVKAEDLKEVKAHEQND